MDRETEILTAVAKAISEGSEPSSILRPLNVTADECRDILITKLSTIVTGYLAAPKYIKDSVILSYRLEKESEEFRHSMEVVTNALRKLLE